MLSSPTSSKTATMFKNSGGSNATLLSAQDLLKLIKSSGRSTFLRVKSFSTFTRSVKWKQRFVILANNELYIYESEMSKKPSLCVPLLGYNQVMRHESGKYPWSFSIEPAVPSVKQCVLSCSTEGERRDWIRAVKETLYRANGLEPPPLSGQLNQLACGTEEEYLDMEEPIFTEDDLKLEMKLPQVGPLAPAGDASDEEVFLEDGSESGSDDIIGIRKASTTSISSSPSSKRKFSEGSVCSTAALGVRVLPPRPESNVLAKPPRYSQVVPDAHTYQNEPRHEEEEEEEEEEDDHKQRCKVNNSKVKASLVTDPDMERDQGKCLAWLQSKSVLGVYLLRKSRKDENLVIMVLTENSKVKEYKLENEGDLYRLAARDREAQFVSLETLLRFYSETTFLTGLNHFLTYGIFECQDNTYEDITIMH